MGPRLGDILVMDSAVAGAMVLKDEFSSELDEIHSKRTTFMLGLGDAEGILRG